MTVPGSVTGFTALTASAALVLSLSGCVAAKAPGDESTNPPTSSRSAPATPTPVSGEPKLVPNGTAAENRLYFRQVGVDLLRNKPNLKGRAIIDAYVRAGFEKKNMELTPDKTSIGLNAWNIEWSVKFGSECIIGQSGNTKFHYFLGPVLSTGTCLFGTTRPITW